MIIKFAKRTKAASYSKDKEEVRIRDKIELKTLIYFIILYYCITIFIWVYQVRTWTCVMYHVLVALILNFMSSCFYMLPMYAILKTYYMLK